MRIAVLSDIHANYHALLSCYEALEALHVDATIYLGDYVTDLPDPQRTLQLMRGWEAQGPCVYIKGNREQYLLDHRAGKTPFWQYGTSSGGLYHTYMRLTPEDLDGFEALPAIDEVHFLDKEAMTLAHGSPFGLRDGMYADTEHTQDVASQMDTALFLCGHTHNVLDYTYAGVRLLNPGTIGCAPRAHFLVLTWQKDGWQPEFFNVAYDVEAAIKDFDAYNYYEEAGIWAHCMKVVLRTGRQVHVHCCNVAYKMARAENPEADKMCIDEKYWTQAAKELGII